MLKYKLQKVVYKKWGENMKKLVLATVIGLSLMGSTAIAAPLHDYSAGKVAIDVGFNWGGNMTPRLGTIDNAPSMNAGVTVGLGNRLALQYKYDNWQTKDVYMKHAGVQFDYQTGFQKHQVNLLYQVAPGISPYIGWRHDSVNLNISSRLGSRKLTGTDNIVQVGILGQYRFAKNKATIWGDIAFSAQNRQSYEIGIGYEVIKSVDLNITYQYDKIESFKVRGFTTGVTYKF